MAENKSGAKNVLGELFVEFGVKGVGGLLKNLNMVSASFLLGKNAANQLVQTLNKPLKEAGDFALQMRKVRNEIGLTNAQGQQIQNWAKNIGIGEGSIFGDIGGMIDKLYNLKTYNFVPKGWYEANRLLTQAGGAPIAFNKYDGTAEGVLQLFKDIAKGMDNIQDVGIKRQIQQELGLSGDFLTYIREIDQLKEAINNLTDAEIKALEENAKTQSALAQAWKRVWQRISALASPSLTKELNILADILTPGKTKEGIKNYVKERVPGVIPGLSYFNQYKEGFDFWKPIVMSGIKEIPTQLTPFTPAPDLDKAGQSDLLQTGLMPATLQSGDIKNVYVTNTQYIDTSDPISAGNQAAAKIDEMATAGQKLNTGR